MQVDDAFVNQTGTHNVKNRYKIFTDEKKKVTLSISTLPHILAFAASSG